MPPLLRPLCSQVAAAAYSAALHGCVRDWYPEVARPGVPKAHPFSWVLQVRLGVKVVRESPYCDEY